MHNIFESNLAVSVNMNMNAILLYEQSINIEFIT